MIHDKKEFGIGLALMTAFLATLVAIFSPLLEGGKNALDYLDGTFNSVSKHSAYYIPAAAEKAKRHEGTAVTLSIKAADDSQAARTEKLFATAGATVAREGAKLTISGDLGRMLDGVLVDADLMFHNDGAAEMRYTPSGQAVTNFSVATNRQYTSAGGDTIKETIWFRVSSWGKQAEICNQYLHKGSKVLVEGRLVPDKDTGGSRVWNRQDGTAAASFEVSASTVRFLSSKSEDDSHYGDENYASAAQQATDTEMGVDDIPF